MTLPAPGSGRPASPPRAGAPGPGDRGPRASAARSLAWQAVREGWTTGVAGGAGRPGRADRGGDRGRPGRPDRSDPRRAGEPGGGRGVFGPKDIGGPAVPGASRGPAGVGLGPEDVGLGPGDGGVPRRPLLALQARPVQSASAGDHASAVVTAVVNAFAVGVICGMAITRRITAALVGVVGLIGVAPVQVALAAGRWSPTGTCCWPP